MSQEKQTTKNAEGIFSALSEMFAEQRFAVLATAGEEGAHASLVGFAATPGLDAILFCTSRATKKFANLLSDPRAALLVDNSGNADADVTGAMAATATGHAEELGGAERDAALRLYAGKLPFMDEFAKSPDTALMRLTVDGYRLVRRFQHVDEVRMAGQARGGAPAPSNRPSAATRPDAGSDRPAS